MDYANLYADFLEKFLRLKRPLKIVFDCSNGTTGIILKKMLNNESGIKGNELRIKNQESSKKFNSIIHNSQFIILNSKLDGNFPAHGPNPMAKGAMEQLQKTILKEKADLGIIFDADGDRVFFVDNHGRLVDAHEIGFVLTQMFKPPFVVSSISSWRLKKWKGESRKRQVFISPVGHYFFKNMMRKENASLGLEHSGHFYFRDFFYCDSGIFAALAVMNFVSALKIPFSEWLDKLPKYYRSGEINFEVKDKEKILRKLEQKYKNFAEQISKLDGLTMEFGRGPSTAAAAGQASSGQNSGEFWFNVRASNTEPLLRLNIETTGKKVLEEKLKEIKKLLAG